jgi:hypothetical protein
MRPYLVEEALLSSVLRVALLPAARDGAFLTHYLAPSQRSRFIPVPALLRALGA